MSQENVEMVRAAIDAVARQDVTRLIELADRHGFQVVSATSLAENAVVSSMLRARCFTALTTSLGITE